MQQTGSGSSTKGVDNPLYFPFTESESFENPTAFKLDNFVDDDSTRHLYSLTIRPSFLPVGISTSNRIIKPGYESYQPVIAARQFGLGQVPPHFHIHHLVESRADLPDGLTAQDATVCLTISTFQYQPICLSPPHQSALILGGTCGKLMSSERL